MKKYLEKIRPHLRDMIDDLTKFGERKMHPTMKPKFVPPIVCNGKCTRYPKSDSSIVMIGCDTN